MGEGKEKENKCPTVVSSCLFCIILLLVLIPETILYHICRKISYIFFFAFFFIIVFPSHHLFLCIKGGVVSHKYITVQAVAAAPIQLIIKRKKNSLSLASPTMHFNENHYFNYVFFYLNLLFYFGFVTIFFRFISFQQRKETTM